MCCDAGAALNAISEQRYKSAEADADQLAKALETIANVHHAFHPYRSKAVELKDCEQSVCVAARKALHLHREVK